MGTTKVTIHFAKTNLSRLIERACAGEDVVIHRGPTPVVRLVPVEHKAPKRAFGALAGKVSVPESFFEPLPPDELKAWSANAGEE